MLPPVPAMSTPWYGMSVAVAPSGNVCFVGSPYAGVNDAEHSGVVYAFVRESARHRWVPVESPIVSPAGPRARAYFGIRMHCEGNHLVVVESGEGGENPQTAYHFNWNDWALLGTVSASVPGAGIHTGVWRDKGGNIGMALGEQSSNEGKLRLFTC